MGFRFYTDEGALIRADFDSSDNLQSMFASLGADGTWHEHKSLVPSPYHAVECDRDQAALAASRIAGDGVDLDSDAVGPGSGEAQ